jgi:hypothetical protein
MIISPYTRWWVIKRPLSKKRRDMARYKEYDYSQGKFIPIHFDRQIFEYSLHYLIDNEIDLSIFDLRYRNDEIGAPAYDPEGEGT